MSDPYSSPPNEFNQRPHTAYTPPNQPGYVPPQPGYNSMPGQAGYVPPQPGYNSMPGQAGYVPPQPGYGPMQGQAGMYAPYPPYGMPYVQPDPQAGLATTGMVLGIISLVLFWGYGLGIIIAVMGIIFSSLGRRSITRSGQATAGLVMSIIALVLSISAIVCIFGGLLHTWY